MLDVIHQRGRVGTLQSTDVGLVFQYSPDWLKRQDAFPLSPRLALRSEPWSGEEVLFFFANLLPEGAVLETLSKLRRIPRGNVYRLLEAFGHECAGAFEIVPSGAEPKKPNRKPTYAKYTRRQLRADLQKLRDNIPLLARHAELHLSLAGAQNKIPVRYAEDELWLPEDNSPSTHILKPALQPQKLFADSVLNEAFCLRLASKIGINVPEVIVLTDPEPVLLIERYDRVVSGDRIERLHQLDLCQLAGVLPDHKYESDGGPGFRECFAQLDRYSTSPAADRLRLVDWTIFNYLIGNADAHAKNLSMLYAADGGLRLSPAYDLLATGYWPDLSDKMAMAIGGERRPAWVQSRHWERFCADVGLNLVQLRRRALNLSEKTIQEIDDVFASLTPTKQFNKHIRSTIEQNAKRIDKRLTIVT